MLFTAEHFLHKSGRGAWKILGLAVMTISEIYPQFLEVAMFSSAIISGYSILFHPNVMSVAEWACCGLVSRLCFVEGFH